MDGSSDPPGSPGRTPPVPPPPPPGSSPAHGYGAAPLTPSGRGGAGWIVGALALLVVLLGAGGLYLLGGGEGTEDLGDTTRSVADGEGSGDQGTDTSDGDADVDEAEQPSAPTASAALSAQELGERFGDAVWRVEVDGCGVSGSGSAFAVAPELFITNAHVVEIDAEPVLVSRRGEEMTGRVIGLRDWPDVAVIAVDQPVETWLEWTPTDELVEGQPLTALSYPTPLLRFSVAPGTLMSFQVEDGQRIALASDEITDHGSSGGPLLDASGRVAGVITEFADGDGRQLVGLSYTHSFLSPVIEEIIAAPAEVTPDCEMAGSPLLPDGWSGTPGATGVDGYGSDAGLDELWDACEGGRMEACDDLYRYSPLDSAYEAFGDSCGERNAPAGWCVDIHGDVTDGATLDGYGSDPGLDALWDACAGGAMQACDDLYLESPLGSVYEAFGDSCGERNAPAGWCVDIHG